MTFIQALKKKPILFTDEMLNKSTQCHMIMSNQDWKTFKRSVD